VRLSVLKSPPILIATPVILLVCILEITHAVFLQRLEWMTYDARVRLAKAVPGHNIQCATNLGFIAISDSTIAAVDSGRFGYKVGLYWPRQVYARALDELTRQGARAAAYDVIFAEERPDHRPVLLPNEEMVSSDDYFATKIADAGNVILAAEKHVLPAHLFMKDAWLVANIGTEKDADGVLRRERPFVDYTNWHPKLVRLAETNGLDLEKTKFEPGKVSFFGNGNGKGIFFHLDKDGFIDEPAQNHLYLQPYTIYRAWGMGIAMAARELGLDLDSADIQTNRHQIVLHGTNGLTRVIPLNSDGSFFIDWSLDIGDPQLAQQAFEEVLQSQVDRAAGSNVVNVWSNRLAVFGSIATGNDLSDVGATPLSENAFLVSKHWNVANSIITGHFIRLTPLPISLLLIAVIGALSAWVTWFSTKPLVSTLIVVGVAIVYIGAAAIAYIQWRLWLPIVLPIGCSGMVTHMMTMTYRVRMEQHERKRVKAVFQRLVSPDIVNELLDSKGISLSARRELTIYFADVRGFTELSDVTQQRAEAYVSEHKLDAEAAESFYDDQARFVLNTVSLYLSTITNAIKSHKGTLDKYIGDCVMAFWGAPVPNPTHAIDAVRAAIDAQRALAALNRQREATNARRAEENAARVRMGLPPVHPLPILSMGSGINTGVVIAGLMGSDNHIANYTVFGREVNLASRLEGVSGHGRIIIGEGTFAAIQNQDAGLALSCIELSPQPVKGFRAPVRIYEVPWDTGTSTGATAFIEKTMFITKAGKR